MKKVLFTLAGLILSFNVFAWTPVSSPGFASDVGDGWIIGTDTIPYGHSIYRWDGDGNWTRMPGAAVKIGGTYSHPYVVNSLNQVYFWNGHSWDFKPGISAQDVTDGWAVSTTAVPGGFQIYRLVGNVWKLMPGAATRIGGIYYKPWMQNAAGTTFEWGGSSWVSHPGIARDVADNFVIGIGPGNPPSTGLYGIWSWNGLAFHQEIGGGATTIGGAGGTPWILTGNGQVWRW